VLVMEAACEVRNTAPHAPRSLIAHEHACATGSGGGRGARCASLNSAASGCEGWRLALFYAEVIVQLIAGK